MVEMKGQLEETFDIRISDDRFCLDSTALDIMKFLGIKLPGSRKTSNQGEVARDASIRSSTLEDRASFHQAELVSSPFINPIEALVKAESKFHQAATKHGFVEYWSMVAPIQNKLSASYILEAYETLGIGISKIGAGNTVGPMPCLPKYSRLAQRFLDILKKEDIVYQREEEYLHSERKSYSKPSRVLLEQLVAQWPQYEIEVKMMALSGPRLAECLSGKVDPGSGGTTQALFEALVATGLPVEYTFTDIAPRLVQKAKKKFEKYNFMTYAVYNVEDAQPDLNNRFDLVLSTNCVHATSSRLRSLQSIRQLLNEDGIVVLSEGVRITPWADINFGLLDGWWSGPDYPLQAPKVWMSEFKAAVYLTYSYSQGSAPESNTQCLLLGTMSKKHNLYRANTPSMSSQHSRRLHRLKTLTFKR